MKKKLIVKGMSCMHCVSAVKGGLADFGEIEDVQVDLEDERVEITLKEDLSDEKIRLSIEDQGYEVVEIREED